VSSLKIGLVTSSGDESLQLATLLKERGVELLYTILPEEIGEQHVANKDINVWLLNVDDDCWHDAVDHLLDESEVPVYFNEPGTLAKQSHPNYWCSNLLDRLYDITGLEKDAPADEIDLPVTSNQSVEAKVATTASAKSEQSAKESSSDTVETLTESLDELELSSVNLPPDIAAELVAELEGISPVLQEENATENVSAESIDEPCRSIENEESSIEEADVEFGSEVQNEEVNFSLDQDEEFELEELDFEGLDLEGLDLEEIELEGLHPQVESNLTRKSLTEKIEPEPIEIEPEPIEIELEPLEIELHDLELEEMDADGQEPDGLALENLAFEDPDSIPSTSDRDQAKQTSSLTESADSPVSNVSIEQEAEFSLQLMEDKPEPNREPEKPDIKAEEPDPDSMSFEEINLDISDDAIAEELAPQEVLASSESEATGLTLQLEETSEQQSQAVFGRAQYKIDDSDLPEEIGYSEGVADTDNNNQCERVTQEDLTSEETASSELSLEPIGEPQIIEGKANFLDDSFEDIVGITSVDDDDENSSEENKIEEPELPRLPETDLTLEAIESDEAHKKPDWITQHESDDISSLDVNAQPSESASESSQENEAEAMNTDTIDTDSIDTDEVNLFEFKDLSLQQEPSEADQISETLEPLIDEAADSLDENFANAQLLVENEMRFNEQDKAELLAEISVDPAEEEIPPASHLSSVASGASEIEIPMLEDAAVDMDFDEQPTMPKLALTPCWVIGASLGGPAAVKRFLQCIPADINASFIIAQHIDENFLPVLAEILSNSSEFEVKIANGSNDMRAGCLFIAPLKGKVVFLQDGSMLVDHSQKWSEPYSPCIDDVIESVSHAYGDLSGAILFSGMGQDGLSGARKMRERGGMVWVQSPESCANASMPQALIDDNQADFVGSPEQLASKLVAYLTTQEKIVAL